MTTIDNIERGIEFNNWMLLFVGIFLAIIIFLLIGIYAQVQVEKVYCDVGQEDIAGDYNTNEGAVTGFITNYCAVEDCVAFNKYQEQIDSKQRCVV
jgi:hypothetical protein